MKRTMWVGRCVCLLFVVLLVFWVAGTPSTALGATQTLGGTATEGSLYIAVGDSGQMSVARYAGQSWQPQAYRQVPPDLASKGSKLYTATYGAQPLGYFGYPSPSATSNTLSGNVITTTWSLSGGAMQVTQRTTYTYPNAYYRLDWTITNTSGNTITDLRFFHGEDTYLANGDNGAGWWDASTNSVGSYKVVNGAEQRMSLQGVTPPSYYVSQYYYTVYDEGTNNRLSTILNTDPNTDNGYALEWDLASLGAGSSWNITAYEKFIAGSVGVLTVNSAVTLDCYAGQSVDVTYAISNLNATSVNATASLSGDQAWSQYIVSPAASFTVPGGSSVNVVVRVTVPAGTSAGTTGNFTLTVNDGSTNSSSTTAVIAKSSYTLTTTASPSAGGSVTKSPNAASYAPGTVVTLTATPAIGYIFTGWSGDLTGTTNPGAITMNANKTVTATFVPTAGPVTLALSPVTVTPGGTVTVPLRITITSGNVGVIQLTVTSSDPTHVALTGITAGDLGGGYTLNPATGVIGWVSITGVTGSHTIANLTFSGTGAVGTTATISVGAASLDMIGDDVGTTVAYSPLTVSASVTATIRGDVNGDGNVTMLDALLTARAAVGLTTLTGSAFQGADVNHDGFITMMDVLLIARIAVGI